MNYVRKTYGGKAEQILREFLEEDVVLRWRSRGDYGRREMQVEELDVDLIEAWMDGSRIGGRAAGAMREEGMYFGMFATIADASQGVMWRIFSLVDQPSWSWVEEKLVGQMMERPRRLMWVRGHIGSGIEGNEALNRRAKMEVQMEKQMHLPDIATQVGIRQAFPLHPTAPAHLTAIRGFLNFFLK